MSQRRSLRRLAVLLVLAAAALGLVACGGGSDSSGDPVKLVSQTFAGDHPLRSGQVDATLNVDLKGLPTFTQPLSLHLAGPFQTNGGKTVPDFAFDLDLQGQTPMTVGAIFAKGAGYLTIEGTAFDLGKDFSRRFRDGYLQARRDAKAKSGSQTTLSALGIDPQRWLKDPQSQGSEDIAGTDTDHVSAGVDVGRLLEDLSKVLSKAQGVTGQAAAAGVPTQLTAEQREAITRSVKAAKVDLWTGKKDRTLRRFTLDVQIAVPQDLQARAGGLRSGHIALDVTFAKLNEPQTIRAPKGARPMSELTAALKQLGLGGAGSSGAGSSGSGSSGSGSSGSGSSGSGSSGSGSSGSGSSSGSGADTATTPSSDPQAAYAKCLTAAGEDLAKVQRCASLLP